MKKVNLLFTVMIVAVLIIMGCSESNPTKTATVTGVVISPNPVSVVKGTLERFTAVVTGANNPSQTVSWRISSGLSEGTEIGELTGLLTVAPNETAEFFTVTATSSEDPSKAGTAIVTVSTVSNVTVSPATVSVYKGGTQQFTAEVTGTNNPPQAVIWTVTGALANNTSIDPNGLLTIDLNETVATLTIKATSKDPTKSGTATVTLTEPPTVTTVTVIPDNVSVAKGTTQQFYAVVNGDNNPPQTVTWTVSGASSNVTSVSANGLLSVASGETASSLTVRATSTFNTTKSGTALVTVTVPIVSEVIVSPATISVNKGQSQQFSVVVNGSNNPPQTVIWSVTGHNSSNTDILSSNGLLMVGIDETALTLIVRATSTYDNTKHGVATVVVTEAETGYAVGDIGPGGGYVFYDKGFISDGWRYLEAAPASREFTAEWGLDGITCPGTAEGIGTGQANTTAIINLLNANGETEKAAQLCDALTINGFSDWYLPSKDELNEMYLQLCVGNNIGGFVINDDVYPHSYYWSSSVFHSDGDEWYSRYCTWLQRFSDGYQPIHYTYSYASRTYQFRVRGVRAF